MNVLITNYHLRNYAGTELYVRDLATALHKRGFGVEVYSPLLGALADEIRRSGINVVDDLSSLTNVPDIIHAQHFKPAVEAIMAVPSVPVVYFLHDRRWDADDPPRHSRVVRYIAVDHNCLDRLVLDNKIPPKVTAVIFNWVDTSRFRLRRAFAERPARALVFSNHAGEDNYFNAIRDACENVGLALDVVGHRFGTARPDPENILAGYDLVFAKARAAIEAMATGAGVIVCDFNGLGGMVDTSNFAHFRKFNFGMKVQTMPITKESIIGEIEKYNAAENRRVAELLRKEASMDQAIDTIVDLYDQTVGSYRIAGKESSLHDKITIDKYHAAIRKEAMHDRLETALKAPLKKIDDRLFSGKLFNLLRPGYRKIFK